jgi:hypothetical protein
MNQGGGEPQYGRSMATDPKNWERHGHPSKKIQEQALAIADDKNTPRTRVTLLASLKESLEAYDLETEEKKQPAKRARWNGKGMTFLMFMKPETQALNQPKETNGGPRTMLGSPPREKYKFKIAFKLPFIQFPVGDGQTSKDTATLSGLLDAGGCCNMGNLAHHKETHEQHPQLIEDFLSLEEQSFETINIGGLKDGVTITHIIRYYIPFVHENEQCYVTLGLTADLPIDTLFGLGFQQDTKMKLDFATRRVESAFLQQSFTIVMKEPRCTNPAHVSSQEHNTPKSLLTTAE